MTIPDRRHTGLSARVLAYVAEHPGKTPTEVGQALRFDSSTGLISYLKRQKQIFGAGPRGWTRLYSTVDEACAAEARITAEAKEQRRMKIEAGRKVGSLRRRAQRTAAGKRPMNVRSYATGGLALGLHVGLHPEVKYTPSKPFVDTRWAVELPPGGGVITQDWRERRLMEAQA